MKVKECRRRDATDRLEVTNLMRRKACSYYEIQQPNDSLRPFLSRNWENSKGWEYPERTGTIITTNKHCVYFSRQVSTRAVESVYLQRRRNRCDKSLTYTHKRYVYVVLNYEFRASRPFTPYFMWEMKTSIILRWKIIILTTKYVHS